MSLVLADRVRETTTSTGTGTITLGGAVQGFQRFSVLGDGNTTYYTIQGTIQWEVGIGTYNANTLTRDTVLDSSSAGALVDFTNGSKDVFVTLPAERAITSIASADGSVTITQVGSLVNLATSTMGAGDVVGPASATDNAVARYNTTTGKLIQNSVVTIDDDGNVAGVDSVTYTGTVPASTPIGTMWFDGATDTLNFKQNNITQQIGEEIFIYGRASNDIVDGQVIAISGAYGTTGVVTFEPAPIGTTNADLIIGIATEPITKNNFGRITAFGTVHGLDTASLGIGVAVYYDPTVVGGYTTTLPSAPNLKMQVGVVTKAAGGVNGSIQVSVIHGSTLEENSDVQLSSPANNQVLTYYTTGGYWRNAAITTVGLTTGTISTAPSSSTDIVNKSYADSIAAGVNFHAACQYATTAALPANTYNNGTGGVGATLTAVAVGTLTIDSYTLVIGDVGKRLLIKNEATQANNGAYVLTQAGTAVLPYILTRATDYDSSGSGTNEVDQGDLILVINGTTNANTSWVQQTPLPITIGTTAIVFIQFAAIQTYSAGTGLTLTTNQFSITNVGTAGTYGAAATVPVITTNAQGQVSSVTNTAIAISGGAVSGNIAGSAGSVANALTAGTGITLSAGTTYDGSAAKTISSLLAQGTSAFTTGTAQTYTAPSNTQWVKVTVVGPGGNGGAATGQRATGGGGGGVAIKWLAMTAAQTLVYTVGTASGTASTVASGTLTITTITANSGTNGAGTAYAASITAGGAGGTATNGDVNITGGQGGYSYGSGTTVTTNFGGKGGDCPGFGSGGPALALVATAGVQGNGFGAGGGGAHGNATAAAGRGGVIIFEAY
jgi:hypothetical protein